MKIEIGGDLAKEFKKRWNQRLAWVRIAGFIVGALFIILGAVNLLTPLGSAVALKTIISIFILGVGVVRFTDYFMSPQLTRFSGRLVGAVFNLIIGVMLIQIPTNLALTIFSCVIAIYLLATGVIKLSYAAKLRYLGIKEFGWVIVDGVFKIMTAFLFFVMPMMSIAMLNVVLGMYLLIDGVSIILDAATTKNFEFKKKTKKSIPKVN